MRSVTSFFNTGLMRKNLTRTWPLFAVYATAWTVLIPVVIGVQLPYYDVGTMEESIFLQRDILSLTSDGAPIFGVIFGLLVALAMFSYLMQGRSTGAMHSLPISRKSLFCTNYASGLLFTTACHALVAVITLVVLLVNGVLYGDVLRALLSFLAVSTLEFLFFYSFAVFSLMLTGQILAAPVFYAIFNVLIPGVETMLGQISSMLLYGYRSTTNLGISRFFCPFYMLAQYTDSIDTSVYTAAGNEYGPVLFVGWGYVLAYAATSLLLILAAWLIYRKRPSENTGDTVAVNWAKPFFKYGAAFCFAITLGQLLYMVFFPNNQEYYNFSTAGLILSLVFAAVVAYYAAEMLLQKSFRVFRRGFAGALGIALVISTLGICLPMDVTGYEGRLPQAEDVESVYISGSYLQHISGTFTSDEDIRLVLRLHEAAIREKNQQIDRVRQYHDQPYDDQRDPYQYCYLRLRYYLTDGTRMERSFSLYLKDEDFASKDSVASRLQQLYDSRSAQTLMIFGTQNLPESSAISGAYMSWSVLEEGPSAEDIAKYGPDYDPGLHSVYHEINLDAQQSRQLYEALLQDLKSGCFTTAALQLVQDAINRGDAEAVNHHLTVEFFYRVSQPTEYSGTAPTVSAEKYYGYDSKDNLYTFYVNVPYSATNTIAVAQQLMGGQLYG